MDLAMNVRLRDYHETKVGPRNIAAPEVDQQSLGSAA